MKLQHSNQQADKNEPGGKTTAAKPPVGSSKSTMSKRGSKVSVLSVASGSDSPKLRRGQWQRSPGKQTVNAADSKGVGRNTSTSVKAPSRQSGQSRHSKETSVGKREKPDMGKNSRTSGKLSEKGLGRETPQSVQSMNRHQVVRKTGKNTEQKRKNGGTQAVGETIRPESQEEESAAGSRIEEGDSVDRAGNDDQIGSKNVAPAAKETDGRIVAMGTKEQVAMETKDGRQVDTVVDQLNEAGDKMDEGDVTMATKEGANRNWEEEIDVREVGGNIENEETVGKEKVVPSQEVDGDEPDSAESNINVTMATEHDNISQGRPDDESPTEDRNSLAAASGHHSNNDANVSDTYKSNARSQHTENHDDAELSNSDADEETINAKNFNSGAPQPTVEENTDEDPGYHGDLTDEEEESDEEGPEASDPEQESGQDLGSICVPLFLDVPPVQKHVLYQPMEFVPHLYYATYAIHYLEKIFTLFSQGNPAYLHIPVP